MSKFVATSSRNNSASNGAVIDILQQIYSNMKTAKACIENIRPNGEKREEVNWFWLLSVLEFQVVWRTTKGSKHKGSKQEE